MGSPSLADFELQTGPPGPLGALGPRPPHEGLGAKYRVAAFRSGSCRVSQLAGSRWAVRAA
eukprot:4062576-Alexandrium_andersonii.AAC.1